MSDARPPSIHASAVMVGTAAVLIRGPSGAGKSRLAFDLILAGRANQISRAVLVGDDRLIVERQGRTLIARPVPELSGLIEIRGLGIRRYEFVAEAPVALVVDLDAADAARLPPLEACSTQIEGVPLPRIPVGAGFSPLPLVIAALTSAESGKTKQERGDCPQGFGNHISPTIATP